MTTKVVNLPTAPENTKQHERFRGLSTDERRAARRRWLLDAGLELFGTNGFHATGVREICAEARLTERYFYESFENREALFAAVYSDAVGRLHGRVLDALERAVSLPPANSRDALRALLEQVREDPRLARVVFVDAVTIGERVGLQSMEAAQSFTDLVFEAVERAGLPRPTNVDHRLVATGLVGATTYIIMRWAASGFAEPVQKVLDHCVLFYEALGAQVFGSTVDYLPR